MVGNNGGKNSPRTGINAKPQFQDLPDMDPAFVMELLAASGYLNTDIAQAFGMSIHQFNDLMKRNPELYERLKAAKEAPNYQVEKALFKRALGYTIKEIVSKAGQPIQVTIKEIAPDPVSCIFWLKNRDPKKWRDVIEHKFTLRDRMERANDAISAPDRGKLLGNGDK